MGKNKYINRLKDMYLYILSYLSVLAIALLTGIFLLGSFTARTEQELRNSYHTKFDFLVSGFDTQLENINNISFRIYNNNIFRLFMVNPTVYGEFEKIDMLRGYSDTNPLVGDIVIYAGDLDVIFTGNGKYKPSAYFGTLQPIPNYREILNQISDTTNVDMLRYDGGVIYLYPISRFSLYTSYSDVYLLFFLPDQKIDLFVSSLIGDLNTSFQLTNKNGDIIYSKETAGGDDSSSGSHFSNRLKNSTSGDPYLIQLESGMCSHYLTVYPDSMMYHLFQYQSLQISIFVLLLLFGVVISVVNAMARYRPVQKMKRELNDIYGILKHNMLNSLLYLQTNQFDEEVLTQIGFADLETPCFSVIVAYPEDAPADFQNRLLSNLWGNPDFENTVELDMVNGISTIIKLPRNNSEDDQKALVSRFDKIISHYHFSPLINVGSVKDTLREASSSFSEALYLGFDPKTRKGRIEYFLANQSISKPDELPEQPFLSFSKSLMLGNYEDVLSSLKSLLQIPCSSEVKNSIWRRIINEILTVSNNICFPVDTKQLDECYLANPSKGIQQLQQTVTGLCLEINRKKARSNSADSEQVFHYIHKHGLDLEISLDKISNECGISINKVNLIVKNKTGLTYREYLVAYRMEKAGQMILNENLSVQKVCEKVGYLSVSHFIKVFKAHFGMTPTQYKTHVKHKNI